MSRRSVVGALVIAVAVTGLVATTVEVLTYVIGPRMLTHYGEFPPLADAPKRTVDARGIPADPLNVAFVGQRLRSGKRCAARAGLSPSRSRGTRA